MCSKEKTELRAENLPTSLDSTHLEEPKFSFEELAYMHF